MLVKNRMSRPPLLIHPDIPIQDALERMRRERVRRYPVVDERGKLLGIVTEQDLLNASPSDATSLSVWEINYLLSKITVGKVMTKDVITVTEDTPLEQAALIMADHKIGGLPVMNGDALVGIITETDLFKIFLELLGAREKGLRVTAEVKNEPGTLHQLTHAINSVGGNILALGTFTGETSTTASVVVKVNCAEPEKVREAITGVVEKITDFRVCC